MRDRSLGSTVRIYFTTHQSTGAVVAPSSAFAAADFKIYKDGSATEKTTTNGITVTSPFDSLTGAHLIEIDTSNNTGDSGFWASGSAYRVVLSTAKTVDSINPTGIMVGEFSIELQTADVRKFGGTAVTARDIGASVLLSPGTGTGQISLSSGAVTAGTVSDKTGYSLTSGTGLGNQTANITGNLSGSVGSVTAGVTVTTNNDKTGYSLLATTGLGNQTANITGNLSGSVGSVGTGGITSTTFAAGAITASAIAADAIGASELAADAIAEIADGVWDEVLSGHLTAGTTGASLNAAGSAGDPWTTTLPGSYTGSQAGAILSAVNSKTTNLPSDPADQSAVEAAILAAWTTALTESYSTDGSAPTPAQALMMILQALTEKAVSGTTMTVKKLDGSTTAFTLTLNDATNPTSLTRAS